MAGVQCSFERVEKKFVLTHAQAEALMRDLTAGYMAVDQYGQHTIRNLYYDTDDYALIRRSIQRPKYKVKFRLRAYGTPMEDSLIFAELKKKHSGVVYKRRAEMTLRQAREYLSGGEKPPQDSQILREIDYTLKFHDIHPMVCLCYERVALYGKENPDLRITFDTGIRFRTDELDLGAGARGQNLLPPGGVLMEIKIPGAMPLWMARALDEMNIRQTSFSKIGTAYTNFIYEKEWGEARSCCKVS